MKYLLIFIITLIIIGCKPKYDKAIWFKNANQKSDNPRFDMVKDLRENYLTQGLSSKEVTKLLGQAEYVDSTSSGISLTYSIGSNPGFHIDPYYLLIDFDLQGKLIETSVIEH